MLGCFKYRKKMVLHAKVVQLFNKTRTYFLTTFHNNASETLPLLVNPADLGLLRWWERQRSTMGGTQRLTRNTNYLIAPPSPMASQRSLVKSQHSAILMTCRDCKHLFHVNSFKSRAFLRMAPTDHWLVFPPFIEFKSAEPRHFGFAWRKKKNGYIYGLRERCPHRHIVQGIKQYLGKCEGRHWRLIFVESKYS